MNTSFHQFDNLTNTSCEQGGLGETIGRANNENTNNIKTINNCEKGRYPVDFSPRDCDVIVGKGMNCYNHVGNQTLRKIVNSKLQDYANTKCKKEKSSVVSSIVSQIHIKGGAFIKKDTDTGLWFDADNFLARDKISQTFRNTLNQEKNNKKRRKQKNAEFEGMDIVLGDGTCNEEGFHDSVAIRKVREDITSFNRTQARMPNMQMNARMPLGSNEKVYSLDNNNVPRGFSPSLNFQASSSDTELYQSLERYAISLPDDILEKDKNPFEPDPIRTVFNKIERRHRI